MHKPRYGHSAFRHSLLLLTIGLVTASIQTTNHNRDESRTGC